MVGMRSQCLSQTQWLDSTCQVTGCQWTDCFLKRLLDAPFSIMKMWLLLQKVSGQPSQVSCMTSNPNLLIQSSSALLQGREVTYITSQLPTGLLSFPCHQRRYMMPFPVPSSGGPHGTQEDILTASKHVQLALR
jgi:hypothetical protein